jgi:thiamine biosynthesis protein ThiS
VLNNKFIIPVFKRKENLLSSGKCKIHTQFDLTLFLWVNILPEGVTVMTKINITVNGRAVTLENSATVADFVAERKVTGTMYVIEKNKQIVNKEDYATEPISEGDVLELAGFVGGG